MDPKPWSRLSAWQHIVRPSPDTGRRTPSPDYSASASRSRAHRPISSLAGNRGVVVEKLLEGEVGNGQRLQFRGGSDGRRPRPTIDHADLAEVLARAEFAHLPCPECSPWPSRTAPGGTPSEPRASLVIVLVRAGGSWSSPCRASSSAVVATTMPKRGTALEPCFEIRLAGHGSSYRCGRGDRATGRAAEPQTSASGPLLCQQCDTPRGISRSRWCPARDQQVSNYGERRSRTWTRTRSRTTPRERRGRRRGSPRPVESVPSHRTRFRDETVGHATSDVEGHVSRPRRGRDVRRRRRGHGPSED